MNAVQGFTHIASQNQTRQKTIHYRTMWNPCLPPDLLQYTTKQDTAQSMRKCILQWSCIILHNLACMYLLSLLRIFSPVENILSACPSITKTPFVLHECNQGTFFSTKQTMKGGISKSLRKARTAPPVFSPSSVSWGNDCLDGFVLRTYVSHVCNGTP